MKSIRETFKAAVRKMRKGLTTLLLTIGLTAAVIAPPPASAQDYGYTSIGAFTGGTATLRASAATNITAITNATLATHVTCTEYDEFVFEMTWTPMTSADGALAVRWQRSSDGTSWPATLAGGTNGFQTGWFYAIGNNATNSAGLAVFSTNITMNSYGYWRPAFITNESAVVLTNVVIRAWKKPARSG